VGEERSNQLLLEHRGFSDALLSLRGIAAIFVVIFHAMQTFKIGGVDPNYFQFPRTWSLSLFIDEALIFLSNGGAAVTFFFVHSGFVLSLSLDKAFERSNGTARTLIIAFYVKRFFRLFPIIFASTLLGYAALSAVYTVQPAAITSNWFKLFYAVAGPSPRLTDALRSAITVGNEFNHFAWSIRVEFLASILMPAVYLAARQRRTLVAFTLCIVALHFIDLQATTGNYVYQWFPTFMLCFMMGTAIGLLPRAIKRWTSAVRADYLCDTACLVCFVILITARPLMGTSHWQAASFIEGLAAVPIIFCIYYSPAGRVFEFCNHRIMTFLGRVSYSLYMVSSICIYVSVLAVVAVFGDGPRFGILRDLATLCVALPLTITIAWSCYFLIESPFMRLGKSAAERIESSRYLKPRIGGNIVTARK